jgi:HSP20 family protein
VNVKENAEGIKIHAELPGIKKEDIQVDVSEGVLTLSGEKKTEKKEENERYHQAERSYGKFQRSFSIPKGVDVSQIDACFNDGVLELTVPKPVIEKRKIEIKSANNTQSQ